jgi:hypothetical protein
MANKSIIPDVIAAASNRRKFVRKLGIASATAGAAFIVNPEKADAATFTDVDILNFALNLEYLEAEFYTKATTGKTINEYPFNVCIGGTGYEGPTIGGKQVNLSNYPIFSCTIAEQIAHDERDHVRLLRSALGSAAVAKPEINLDAAGFGFCNEKDFLKLARMFEDIGVSAYAGAAPLISSKSILGTAARILAAEAEHTGNIRLQVAKLNVATKPMDHVDIIPPPSGRLFFSLNPTTGLAAVRTPGQVLYLAYGNLANARSGGFFPKGANGRFVMSTYEA